MSAAELARKLGIDVKNIRLLLDAPVKHGWLELKRDRVIEPKIVYWYRLGARAFAEPGDVGEVAANAECTLPPRSVFDLRDEGIPMPTGARFGVWADGRINISRAGRVTEQLSPVEARDLARVLRERATEEEGA
jgi:hypothetical protein